MHLAPGERAILSYYGNPVQAERAVQELKEAGFRSVEVEKIPKLSLVSDDSLRSYALGVAQLSQSVAEVDGQFPWTTDPAANWTATEPLENYTYMITLVVNNQNATQALSIVRKYASIVN